MRQTLRRLSLLFIVVFFSVASVQAQAVRIDADDIGGVVTGARGPEAGV
jgi:hypothetical protein